MANRHKHHKHKAEGGRMEYTKDSNVQREAGDEKDGFRHGGKAKHHHHEHKAHGGRSKARGDKRARGGGVNSPFSSAKMSEEKHHSKEAGHGAASAYHKEGHGKHHRKDGGKVDGECEE